MENKSFAISSHVSDLPALAAGHFQCSIPAQPVGGYSLVLKNASTNSQSELKTVTDKVVHSAPLDISKYPGISQLVLTVAGDSQPSVTIPLVLDVSKTLNKKDILFTITQVPGLLPADLPASIALSRNDKDPAHSVVSGINYEITQDMVGEGKDMVFYGDTITVKAPLHLQGKNITIHARNIISLGGSIDLSGGGPKDNFIAGSRATDGLAVAGMGDNGNAGSPNPGVGSTGQNGGNLLIVAESIFGDFMLTSNGGNGGRGQDGGNGSDGMPGGNGEKDQFSQNWAGYNAPSKDGTRGQDGGRGGDGGPAGASGSGGNGGSATGAFINMTGNIYVNATAGKAGEKAIPGVPGKGKDGGRGGLRGWVAGGKIIWSFPTDNGREVRYHEHGRHGDDGNKIENTGVYKDGTAGTYVPKANIPYTAFINTYPSNLSQRSLSLRVAELLYMNEAYDNTVTMLKWLMQVTPKAGDPIQPPGQSVEWVQINRRATALMDQLKQGLSFYGQPRSHVPVLELSAYQQELDSLIVLGGIIEARYETYTNTQKSKDEKITALKETAAQQDKLIAQIVTIRGQLMNVEMPEIQNEIAQLTITVSDKLDQINKTSAAFKQAVEDKAKCTFDQIFGFIAAVITMGVDVYDAISGIVKAIQMVDNIAKSMEDVIKEVRIAGKGIADFKKMWDDAKKTIPKSAPDTTKIAVQKEDFDNAIAPYLDMKEAGAYKQMVHDYLNTVQTRNEKVMKYSSMVTDTERLGAEVDQKTAEITRIRSIIAGAFDPSLTELASFMETAYAGVKNMILRYLFEENEAYIFWALQTRPFKSGTLTIAQMATAHASLKGEIIDKKNTILGLKEKFSGSVITITAKDYPAEFEKFRSIRLTPKGNKVHDLTFSLLPDNTAFGSHRWQVLANTYSISIPGAVTTNKKLDTRLVHNGQVQVLNMSGKAMPFSHSSVLSNYEYDFSNGSDVYKSGGSLGGDELNKDIIGLSPFAAWTVRIVADDNPGLNLDKVDQVVLSFSGVYRLLPTMLA
ncbi:MAG: hypothetical protein V4722_22215 [Bacteroidota bacterium]